MGELIRAVKTTIFFGQVEVDAYKLQNYRFEKRLGITGVSESLGYAKGWFHRLPKKGATQFNALLDNGFTGCQIYNREEVRALYPWSDVLRQANGLRDISGRLLPFPPSLEL